ncbi:MAG: endonuclease NucS [Candidatus Krumholzibacteriota bacterium]|nr:endonuclease NucS [Candidatus Krumholzibacteriota bacterium]
MLEKDIENLIAMYPEEIFKGEGFKLIEQQYSVEGKRIDILFEDGVGRKVIVEVKRGILNRNASGQIAEYYGRLKSKNKDTFYEMILCANVIPKERRLFLENIGIECKELGIAFISELSKKYDYTFIDDRPSYQNKQRANNKITSHYSIDSNTEDISTWIFQGNPQRYDILNSLSDNEIGNNIHWSVNQHKRKIKKNHIGLIWMSGKDAGIYALTRIETDPALRKDHPAERKYWLNDSEKEEAVRVEMTILKRLLNKPILKKDLLKINELNNLSILRHYQGTNFPVKDTEWKIISQLI